MMVKVFWCDPRTFCYFWGSRWGFLCGNFFSPAWWDWCTGSFCDGMYFDQLQFWFVFDFRSALSRSFSCCRISCVNQGHGRPLMRLVISGAWWLNEFDNMCLKCFHATFGSVCGYTRSQFSWQSSLIITLGLYLEKFWHLIVFGSYLWKLRLRTTPIISWSLNDKGITVSWEIFDLSFVRVRSINVADVSVIRVGFDMSWSKPYKFRNCFWSLWSFRTR